ncbi:MAG TPA: TlpA disulfide reductase family protein [Flavisolibacter sp.]|jgi:thiol-disulfide isomerase/thioredoxin
MIKLIKGLLFSSLFFLVSAVHAQEIPVWKLADLQSAIRNSQAPTIINFWATFCKPCIAELPYFQTLANRYKDQGVKLIMVSLDLKEAYPAKVRSFTKKLKLTSPVVFLDESNADLFCPAVDSSWSGAIPASIFINNKTGYKKFYEEELSKEKLEKEIRSMLKPDEKTNDQKSF